MNDAINNQNITLVPPIVKKQVVISKNDADQNYLYEMAEFYLGLRYNYHPSNVLNKFDLLLTYYHPENYQAAKSDFHELIETIEETDTTNSFYIQEVKKRESIKNNQLLIKGINRVFSPIPAKNINKAFFTRKS